MQSAIDGKRTAGEILKHVGQVLAEHRAASFFERLWQYDKVVFYAPRR